MEHNRHIKMLSIVALVIAIVGMTLGFAAFSTTLSISSNASVTPNRNDFNVRFCNESNISSCDDYLETFFVYPASELNGATGDTASMSYSLIRKLNVHFTKPAQSVTYTFYVQNVGEYDAYLTEIYATDPTGNATVMWCEPSSDSENTATESLVRDACNGISVSTNFDGNSYSLDHGSTIYGEKIEKGTSKRVELTVSYKEGSALADGPFDVYIGDIMFNFSTVDNEVNLISFSIDGTTYQAIEGMTWSEWIDSEYNSEYYMSNDSMFRHAGTRIDISSVYDIIDEDGMYYSTRIPGPY